MSQPPQPPFSGQPYPEQPYSGQPNPDVPTSVPPQPGFPPGYPPPQSGSEPGFQPGSQPVYPPQPGSPPVYPAQPGSQPGSQPGFPPPQSGFPPPPPPYGQQPGYPTSGQPAYTPGPEYGQQPEYGQPQPGYAMGGPQPPKKSKALPIILISVAVLLVLCVGGAAVVFVAARDKTQEVVNAAESAAATPTAPAEPTEPTGTTEPTPTETTPARTIKIVEPKRLGGRPKLTDAQFERAAEQMQSQLETQPGATNAIGALYGTPANRDIVIVAGIEAPVQDPAQELDSALLGVGVGGLKVTGITEISPGPLGGKAKCGKATASGIDMALCGWADEGSVGWIIWYFKSVSKAKAEFPKLRGQIEKSS